MNGRSVPKTSEERARLKAEVLAWMRVTGRGHKAAAGHFDVGVSTVAGWAREERARTGEKAPGPNGAPIREAVDEPVDELTPEPEEEVEIEDREEWLRRGVRDAIRQREKWANKGHGGTAARWEAIAKEYRDELDAMRAAREAARPAAAVDPEDALRKLIAMVPSICRGHLGLARELRAALDLELIKWSQN